MELCDLTLVKPEENLACDEALLSFCEEVGHGGILRFWHPTHYFVAVGYANRLSTEVNLPFCHQHGIPVFRRCTGGGTVLQGPGCLNYALILPSDGEIESLHSITGTNDYILERHSQALSKLVGGAVEKQGHTDLAVGGLKFSGNAQRRGKGFLLFHGCFLVNMDLDLVEKTLLLPSRQPDYRLNRSHRDFLMNLRVPEEDLKLALIQAWGAERRLPEIPFERIGALVQEKYSQASWNQKF